MLKLSIGPVMSVKITPEEIATAKKVQADFKISLEKLDAAYKNINDFMNLITTNHPSKEDFSSKYKGRLARFKRKLISGFNEFIFSVRNIINDMEKIGDPEMLKIREVLVGEIGEMSDSINQIAELLKSPGENNFTSGLEKLNTDIEKRISNIKDVVEHQLYSHINQDILGKLKISKILEIRKRMRIIKYI